MFIEIASKLCFLRFPVVSLCCNLQVHVNVCARRSTRAHVRRHTRRARISGLGVAAGAELVPRSVHLRLI